jgi:trans-2-enoyl-CoA reductase
LYEQIEYISSSEPVGGPKSALVKGGLSDIEGFREEFLYHHGFGIKGVDYEGDVDV